jgi:photosystem II stability/assembly factor-like uncharacterized protein
LHPGKADRSGVRFLPLIIAAALTLQASGVTWTAQQSGVGARLRGVSAASVNVVWASGSNGVVLRTEDAGRTWRQLIVPDAGDLDFRDIDALDERTACVLSIGNGDASRIYRTSDAGSTWTLQFRNEDPQAFFDAMAFTGRRGFAFSDSVAGRFVILTTENGGAAWAPVPVSSLPAALPGEGAYAASGSNIAARGNDVWIATTASRVLRSSDGGATWTVAQTPVVKGPSAGIFSIAFRDSKNGIVVGGDYKQERAAMDNAAVTRDGGRTWRLVRGLSGYRSAVAYVPSMRRTIVAVGPSGTDVSLDDGDTWTAVSGGGFHALSFAPKSPIAWAVGEAGTIARLSGWRDRGI